MPPLDPSPILQTAFAFWNSKVLLTAVEFGLFTTLGDRRLGGAALGAELGLHPRGISDFLDALVSMNFLEREGDGLHAPSKSAQLETSAARASSRNDPLTNLGRAVLALLGERQLKA